MADWLQFEETETASDGSDKRLNWFEAQGLGSADGDKENGDGGGDYAAGDGADASVPVGAEPGDNRCAVCREDLDQFFQEDSEEWHLKDAVRIDGVTYHRLCSRDLSALVPHSISIGPTRYFR